MVFQSPKVREKSTFLLHSSFASKGTKNSFSLKNLGYKKIIVDNIKD